VLADIPGFSFHFARHALGREAEAELPVIEDFDNPLAAVEGEFDLIIVQTVFEHLDSPRLIAEYLLDRLKPVVSSGSTTSGLRAQASTHLPASPRGVQRSSTSPSSWTSSTASAPNR
jgi:hypothetical protein